jgi:hypothetical protein
MLARRISPPDPRRTNPPHRDGGDARRDPAAARAQGRWRTVERQPSRGPHGEVRWWERPDPGGDQLLWEAVQRLQEARLRHGVTLLVLAEQLTAIGYPRARETLSRILNGKRPTTWETAEALALVLDVDLTWFSVRRWGDAGSDADVHHLDAHRSRDPD